MTGCALHGEAFTHACPGCLDHLDDLVIAEQVRERLANDTGRRLTLEELASETGFDLDDLEGGGAEGHARWSDGVAVSVFAEPLAQARAGFEGLDGIDVEEALAALDLIEQRATEMEALVLAGRRISAWDAAQITPAIPARLISDLDVALAAVLSAREEAQP